MLTFCESVPKKKKRIEIKKFLKRSQRVLGRHYTTAPWPLFQKFLFKKMIKNCLSWFTTLIKNSNLKNFSFKKHLHFLHFLHNFIPEDNNLHHYPIFYITSPTFTYITYIYHSSASDRENVTDVVGNDFICNDTGLISSFHAIQRFYWTKENTCTKSLS